MDTTYLLFLLTFLFFPLIALSVSINVQTEILFKFFKIAGITFLIHNVFFLLGFSLKGDYVDYIIFSFEYFLFCFIIFSLYKTRNIYIKIFFVLTAILIAFTFIIGLLGMFFFDSQNYEADATFHFESDDKTYETRSYIFGHATVSITRYTFETYRIFTYLPIEHKLDKTDFFADRTELNMDEPGLKISVVGNKHSRQIIFEFSNGKTFSKQVN